MKMEGSKAPVERVSLNRRKLKQEGLSKGGKEWLVQSLFFLCCMERKSLFVTKERVFSLNTTLVCNLVNLEPSYSLISPSHAPVSNRVCSVIVRAD